VLSLGSLGTPGSSAPSVRFAFTSRDAGRSEPPFNTLNLSTDVGDDASAVERNRSDVLARLNIGRAVWLQARHGSEVDVVDADDALDRGPHRVDGLVTTASALALGSLAADCALVVLADPAAGVIATLHCGRAGLVEGIVAAGVAAMRDRGARAISAAIGPTICGSCYVVPAEMAAAVIDLVPQAASHYGPSALDIRAGVVAQLLAAGVRVRRLVGGCTLEDPTVFSYRRDHVTGRHGALIWRTT
jgi:polyphenol oxidase